MESNLLMTSSISKAMKLIRIMPIVGMAAFVISWSYSSPYTMLYLATTYAPLKTSRNTFSWIVSYDTLRIRFRAC